MAKQKKTLYIGLNDRGIPIGENHHNANLSDDQCEQMRSIYEAGGISLAKVGDKFGVPKSTAANICNYTNRANVAVRQKKVTIYE